MKYNLILCKNSETYSKIGKILDENAIPYGWHLSYGYTIYQEAKEKVLKILAKDKSLDFTIEQE